MKVLACVFMMGESRYYDAGRECVRALLEQSDFDVFVWCDNPARLQIPWQERLRVSSFCAEPPAYAGRNFLRKLDGLAEALRDSRPDYVLSVDADALLVRQLKAEDIRRALDGGSMGMVVQGEAQDGNTSATEMVYNYLLGLKLLLGVELEEPSGEKIRYFNNGIVLAEVEEMRALLSWALPLASRLGPAHDLGGVFVADQHYFQVWAHQQGKDRIRELPWHWNHCRHWDEGFPREGTTFLHFSNYCRGPVPGLAREMRHLRRKHQSFTDRLLDSIQGLWRKL